MEKRTCVRWGVLWRFWVNYPWAISKNISVRLLIVASVEKLLMSSANLKSGKEHQPTGKPTFRLICKLRKRLRAATGGEQYLQTDWGHGHMLCDLPPKTAAHEAPVAA